MARTSAAQDERKVPMLLALIRLLLGPVLLWQGKIVRRNILRVADPTGARIGTSGGGPPLRLLILGGVLQYGIVQFPSSTTVPLELPFTGTGLQGLNGKVFVFRGVVE